VNDAWLVAAIIGFVAGLRSMTAPAAISWAAHLGWLKLAETKVAFVGSTTATTILTFLAVAELVADKLPITSKRTAFAPMLVRIMMGALSAACLCLAKGESLGLGLPMGGAAAVLGAFLGYEVRRRLVTGLRLKDIWVALPEDLVAIGFALLAITR
jgi:uncharacterized membrane protein